MPAPFIENVCRKSCKQERSRQDQNEKGNLLTIPFERAHIHAFGAVDDLVAVLDASDSLYAVVTLEALACIHKYREEGKATRQVHFARPPTKVFLF